MILRTLREKDVHEVYDAFKKAQINSQNAIKSSSGFYEYSLSEDQIAQRISAGANISLAVEEKGRIILYGIAYPISRTDEIDSDEVLKNLEGERDLAYMDQLFLEKGMPTYEAGRFMDAWTNEIFKSQAKGIVCAIPQNPWKNQASTRIALSRGFRRYGSVKEKTCELGIFAKPLWTKDIDFPRHFSLRQ